MMISPNAFEIPEDGVEMSSRKSGEIEDGDDCCGCCGCCGCLCCGCELCVPGPGQGCATICRSGALADPETQFDPSFFSCVQRSALCWVLLISSPALPRADSPQPNLQPAAACRSGASFGSHGCTRTDRASACRHCAASMLSVLPSRMGQDRGLEEKRRRGLSLSPRGSPLRTASRTARPFPHAGCAIPNPHE
jgi:hypothetical protein